MTDNKGTENPSNDTRVQEEKLVSGLLWLNVKVFALSMGLLTGLAVFIATNWLLIKGGENIGMHLQLLSQFFIGYSVTFKGSIIGFFYGLVTGGVAGGLVSLIYNKITSFKV